MENSLGRVTTARQTWTGRRRMLILWLFVATVLGVSIMLGRYPTPYFTNPQDLLQNQLLQELVLQLRLPRIIAAFLMGMVLAASGAVLQMIFRNPMVDSGFLGVSPGASFGASFAIIFLGASPFAIQTTAAFFACFGLAASYLIARNLKYGDWVLRLVLAGIAVSALFSSGIGVLKYLADPLKHLPEITFWLLGGLWSMTWIDVVQMLPVVVPCMAIVYLMRWRLNLLSLRDETAFSLGVVASRERIIMLVAAVAATAVVVSKAGIVGWIGLIVPHVARRLLGSDAQQSLPASMLIGAIFALICDDFSRTALSGEIPLGIITSLAGALSFIFLMAQRRMGVRG